jgi:transcriptional regulator of arginine metabolism
VKTTVRAATKGERQQAIREIVAREGVGSQNELVERLAARGIVATQATVSRDIADLALVKLWRGQRHVYVLPEDVAGPGLLVPTTSTVIATERLRRILGENPVRVGRSGLTLVLTGSPGTANLIAQAIDEALTEQVGTVAGDNTSLVLFADADALERWLARFNQLQPSASDAVGSEVPR